MKLHADIETFSECDLKVAGLYKYAEHPSTEVTVFCYALDNGPVNVWLPYEVWDIPQQVLDGIRARPEFDEDATIHTSMTAPDALRWHVSLGNEFSAHNAQFERTVLNGVAGQKLDFPLIEINQTSCTMAKCRAHGLPGALEDAARALGTHPKLATGKNAMRAFMKPRNKKGAARWTPATDPQDFIELVAYCIDDVKAERDLDNAIPDLTQPEMAVYRMDQRMNDRGVAVDLESVANIQYLIAVRKAELEAQCLEWTGLRPSQREKIAEWIRANGYPRLADMQADTITKLVTNHELPSRVRDVLRLYSTYNAKAVAKFGVIEDMVCADGRIRGMFQYHGAGTGRWSSTGVQLQNISRGYIDDPEAAIEACAARDLNLIRSLW